MSYNRQQILKQIDTHLHSSNIEEDFKFITNLQKEQGPWLSTELVEISAIQGIAKLYEDNYLDFMLSEYIGHSREDNSFEKTAA